MEWFEKFISEYVAEDKREEVVTKFKKEIFPKSAVPKEEFNTTRAELTAEREKIDTLNKSLEDLKVESKTVEEYQEKLHNWEEKYSQLEKESNEKISSIQKKVKLKTVLSEVGVIPDAIDLLTDKYTGSLEMDEKGEFKNLEELKNKVAEEHKGLLLTVEENSTEKGQGTNAKGTKSYEEMSPEDYIKEFQNRQNK